MTTEQLNNFIRFYLGGISTDVISDDNLNLIIQFVKGSGVAKNDCQEKYFATKATVEWLIRAAAKATSGQESSGAVRSREEKIGKRRIKVEYSTHSQSSNSFKPYDWQEVLAQLVKDPKSLLCDPFPDISKSRKGNVIIGGTGKGRFDCGTPWRQNVNKVSLQAYRKDFVSKIKDAGTSGGGSGQYSDEIYSTLEFFDNYEFYK